MKPTRKYAKTYTVKHGRGWKYSRDIPRDLQAVLRKKTWTRYLGASLDVAEREALKLRVEHNELIVTLRSLTEAERRIMASPPIRLTAPAYAGGGLSPDVSFERMDAAYAAIAGQPMPTTSTGGGGTGSLASLIPVWVKRNKPRPDSVDTMRLHVGRFVAHARDREPCAFTRAHAGAWRDALEDNPTMGMRTVAKHLDSLNALFRAGMSGLAVDHNPFDRIKTVKKGGKYHEARGKRGFTSTEARTIFSAITAMPEDFQWMAKLCAALGSRSGELAQLRTADVIEIDGIPCLHLTDEEGDLKNRHSLRDVPIPPSCLGIVAYAARKGGKWLFDYPAHGGRSRGKTYQHAASSFLRNVAKITDKAVTWHGWRHRFKSLCDTVLMPPAVKHAIGGWKLEPGEAGEYGEGPAMAVRLEWLERVDASASAPWRGVGLKHLATTVAAVRPWED